MFQQSLHSEIMTIIYLTNHSTSLQVRLQFGGETIQRCLYQDHSKLSTSRFMALKFFLGVAGEVVPDVEKM